MKRVSTMYTITLFLLTSGAAICLSTTASGAAQPQSAKKVISPQAGRKIALEPSTPINYDTLIEDAVKLVKTKPDQAFAKAQQAIPLNPARPEAYFYSAVAMYRQGQYDGAEKFAKLALDRASDDPAAPVSKSGVQEVLTSISGKLVFRQLVSEGDVALANGSRAKAAEKYLAAYKLSPSSGEVGIKAIDLLVSIPSDGHNGCLTWWLVASVAHHSSNDAAKERAKTIFANADKKFLISFWVAQSIVDHWNGKQDESKEEMGYAVEIDPDSWLVNQVQGLCLFDSGDAPGAIRQFRAQNRLRAQNKIPPVPESDYEGGLPELIGLRLSDRLAKSPEFLEFLKDTYGSEAFHHSQTANIGSIVVKHSEIAQTTDKNGEINFITLYSDDNVTRSYCEDGLKSVVFDVLRGETLPSATGESYDGTAYKGEMSYFVRGLLNLVENNYVEQSLILLQFVPYTRIDHSGPLPSKNYPFAALSVAALKSSNKELIQTILDRRLYPNREEDHNAAYAALVAASGASYPETAETTASGSGSSGSSVSSSSSGSLSRNRARSNVETPDSVNSVFLPPPINPQTISADFLLAVKERQVDFATYYLEHGANVNVANDLNDPVILIAAKNGQTDMVKLLLDKGADANARNGKAEPALLVAVCNGPADMVKLLLDKGADARVKWNDGTILSSAMLGHSELSVETVTLLLDHGIDINKGSGGWNPLYCAANAGRLDLAKLLIAHHADPNGKHGYQTPASEARFLGHDAVADFIVAHGGKEDE